MLTFPSLDVGATISQTLTLSNAASGPVPVSGLVATGDYSATSTCGSALAAGASCTVTVTFKPTTTGSRTGTVGVNLDPSTTALTGNGVDFTVVANPGAGTVIAGYNTTFSVVTTPLAGFAAGLHLSCTTTVPGSTCTVAAGSVGGAAAVTTSVAITTTSKYTVVGYGGYAGRGWLWTIGLASGCLLLIGRRRAGADGAGWVVDGAAGLYEFGADGVLGAAAGAELGVYGAGDVQLYGHGDGRISGALGNVLIDGDGEVGLLERSGYRRSQCVCVLSRMLQGHCEGLRWRSW